MNSFSQKSDSTNALMFAAGLGTRLRPATLTNPKPCLPLNGISLGYYNLPYLEHINCETIVANTFHLPDQVQELYSNALKNILFSNETDFIKGSGGGLKQAASFFKNKNIPVLAMNADEVFFTETPEFLNQVLNQHNQNNNTATLVVTQHPEAGKKFGAIWCDGKTVVGIGKSAPSQTAIPWHFIGLQFLDQKIISNIPENQETNIFYDILIHQLETKRIEIYPLDCDWYEVGNIEDYTLAKQKIKQKLVTVKYYQDHYESLKKYPASHLSDLA